MSLVTTLAHDPLNTSCSEPQTRPGPLCTVIKPLTSSYALSKWSRSHRGFSPSRNPPPLALRLGACGHRFVATMGFGGNLIKRLPSTPSLPSLVDLTDEKDRFIPRLSFFKRRIRLKGNSKISIPLGAVLLFPCIVIILIIVLIVRHPSSPGGLMMPAGAPPSIRQVLKQPSQVRANTNITIAK